jgi:hypothetical protein
LIYPVRFDIVPRGTAIWDVSRGTFREAEWPKSSL